MHFRYISETARGSGCHWFDCEEASPYLVNATWRLDLCQQLRCTAFERSVWGWWFPYKALGAYVVKEWSTCMEAAWPSSGWQPHRLRRLPGRKKVEYSACPKTDIQNSWSFCALISWHKVVFKSLDEMFIASEFCVWIWMFFVVSASTFHTLEKYFVPIYARITNGKYVWTWTNFNGVKSGDLLSMLN